MAEPSEYSLAKVTPGSFWYCRIEGKDIGPLSSGRLRQLARQGQVCADDHVRLGKGGDWVPAADVHGLFRGLTPRNRSELEDVLEGDAANRPQATGPPVQVGYIVSDWLTNAARWVGGSMQLLRVIFSWICLAVVVISLGSLVARNLSLDTWSSAADPFDTLTTVREELRGLRAAKATDEQWNEFSASSRAKLAPVIAELEDRAGADDRLSQQLLWAARDVWPDVVANGRLEASDAVQQFETHLANAGRLREGHSLYPQTYRPGRLARFVSDLLPQSSDGWLVAGIVIADAALILSVPVWWWRRRA